MGSDVQDIYWEGKSEGNRGGCQMMQAWLCEREGLGRSVGDAAWSARKALAMLMRSSGAQVACFPAMGLPFCSCHAHHWPMGSVASTPNKAVATQPAAQAVGQLLFPKQIWVAYFHDHRSHQQFSNFTVLSFHHQRKADTSPWILWKDVNGLAGVSAKTCSNQLCTERQYRMWSQRHGTGSPPLLP